MQAAGGPHTCQSQHHGAGEGSQRVGGASQEQSQQSGHLSGSGRSQGSHQTSEGMWIWLFVGHCPLVCTSVYLLWWLALRFLISSRQETGCLFSQGWGFVSVSASVLCRSLARFFVRRQSSLSVGGKIISQSVARFFVNDRFLCPSSLSFTGEVPCHWQCCHLSISGKVLCPSVVRLFDNDQVLRRWQGSVNDKVLCRQMARFFASNSVNSLSLTSHWQSSLLVVKSLQATVVSDKVLCLWQDSLLMTMQVLCQSVARFSFSGKARHSSCISLSTSPNNITDVHRLLEPRQGTAAVYHLARRQTT